MPLETVCRQCNTRLRIREEHLGRSIKCPTCSATVPAEDLKPPAAANNPFAGSDEASEASPAVNPYASPETPVESAGGPALTDSLIVTDGIRTAMRQTRPWVIFAAVLGFLASAMMLLGALTLIAAGAMSGRGPQMTGTLMGGIVYLLMGSVYFAGSYFLLAYGQRIGKFLSSDAIADL
jgi:hypothetical protein